jgi:hypothetical protein
MKRILVCLKLAWCSIITLRSTDSTASMPAVLASACQLGGPHSHKKESAYILSLCAVKEGGHDMSQSSGNDRHRLLTAQQRSG